MNTHNETTLITSNDRETIACWLQKTLAEWLDIDVSEMNRDAEFSNYALDSVSALRLVGELEMQLNQSIEPTILNRYRTINALAAHLENLAEEVA